MKYAAKLEEQAWQRVRYIVSSETVVAVSLNWNVSVIMNDVPSVR